MELERVGEHQGPPERVIVLCGTDALIKVSDQIRQQNAGGQVPVYAVIAQEVAESAVVM